VLFAALRASITLRLGDFQDHLFFSYNIQLRLLKLEQSFTLLFLLDWPDFLLVPEPYMLIVFLKLRIILIKQFL